MAAKKRKPRKNMQKRLDTLVGDMVASGIHLEEGLLEFEAVFLRRVMAEHNGNQSRAAERLGMHRNTLRNRLRRCGLL